MAYDGPPSPAMTTRAKAVHTAMAEVRKVNDALNTRNGPNTLDTVRLPLQSQVKVWKKEDGKVRTLYYRSIRRTVFSIYLQDRRRFGRHQ